MNKSKTMILLCGFYITTFMGTVFTNAYMQTFLIRSGYNGEQRGILTAGISFVAILSPIIVGFLCDRFKTVKKAFNVTLILLTIVAFIFYQITQVPFFMHIIIYSLLGGLWRTMMTIQDTWAIEIDDYFKDRYGRIRAFGAIGWMIANPFAGWCIEQYGYGVLSWAAAGLAIFNLVYSMFLPDATKDENAEPVHFSDLKLLFKNKDYILIVLVFFFLQMMQVADGLTVVDKMMALGGGEGIVGTRSSMQALAELPLFFLGSILLKKFGGLKLLMFGIMMYIVRYIGFALVQSPELIVAVSLTQFCTFPLIMITSRTLIHDASPPNLKTSGVTIATAIYVGIPSFIAPILIGKMIDAIGTDATLLTVTIFGGIALLLGAVYAATKKKGTVEPEATN